MSLGTYPEITLKEARELRDQARALVAKGIDPRSQRRDVGVGDIFRNQIHYYGENSTWRVKILTKRQFVILLNGQQVGGILSSTFDITRVGFGYMPQAVTAVSISGFVRTRNSRAGGRTPETITIYGDSSSTDIHGGWPYFMRRALEGSAGVLVGSITNLAVPGYTTAPGTHSTSHSVCAIRSICELTLYGYDPAQLKRREGTAF